MSKLKFLDGLTLGWKNIAGHRGRSVIIVVTISVLFAAVLGFNTLLNGLERTFANAASSNSEDKFYVATNFEPETISCFDDVNERCVLTPAPENSDEIIQKRLERYHGHKVGTMYERTFYWMEERPNLQTGEIDHVQHMEIYYVLSKSVVEDLGIELSDEVSDKLPVLLPRGEQLSEARQQVFYLAGNYSATKSGTPQMAKGGVLNLILDTIHGSTREMFLIDDGSGKIEQFLEKGQAEVAREDKGNGVRKDSAQYDVVVFGEAEDALDYYQNAWQDGREFGYDYYDRYSYNIRDVFGNVIHIASAFTELRAIALLIAGLILIVAVCIATLTFVHVINDDAPTIALYHSMGASKGNVIGIYFVYIFSLCLMAILACVVVALILVGIVAAVDGVSLTTAIEEFYELTSFSGVTFLGWDLISGVMLGLMILVAPLALLCSLRTFSAKNIAKQLKEDQL